MDEGDLIGRSRELQRIAAACQDAARGTGSLTVVSGGKGVGRSRLLEAAAAAAAEEQLAVVATRCWPDGGAPPLWPWPMIVRELCGPDAAELLDHGPAAPAVTAVTVDDGRFVALAGVAEQVVAAADERPVCLVIDDIHAADAGSLLLLRFVARASPRSRLAVVVSRRTCAPPSGPREAQLLDAVEADGSPVVLRPFDGAQTVRFLQAQGVVGADELDGDDELLRTVVQVCRGKPAALRHLATGASDLLDGVRRTVRRLLPSLSDAHLSVLQAAAVLGTRPSMDEVTEMAGCDRARVLAAVAEAAALGLVCGDVPTRLDFGHEQVRSTLEDEMLASVRLDTHARVASLAASSPSRSRQWARRVAAAAVEDEISLPPAQLVRWAHHARAAAPRSLADARTAVAACRVAARALAADPADGKAEALVSAAVELHDHDSRGLGPPPAALLVEWGQAALQRGLLDEASRRFGRAVAAARLADDDVTLAEAVLGLSGQWLNQVRAPLDRARLRGLQRDLLLRLRERRRSAIDEAEADDEEGEEAEGEVDDTAGLRARLEMRLAAEAVYDGRPVEPVFAALDRARELGDAWVLAEALALCHNSLLAPEHAHRRLPVADELIRVAAGVDGRLGLLGLRWRVIDLFLLGDDRAGRALDALRGEAAALDNPSLLNTADLLDVMLLVRAGRLDEAEEAAQRAHHRGQVAGEGDALNYLCVHLLVIRWLQDRHGELAETIESMLGSVSVAAGEFAFRAGAAVAAARGGRIDRARGELDALVADGLDALARSSTWLTGMTSIVELAAMLDEAAVARQAYDLIAPYADRPVMPSIAVVCLGSAERWLGIAAGIWGDHDLACRHLERAARANLALGNRPMAAMTRADLACALLARAAPGDGERAVELLGRAIDAAEDMGMSRRAETWRESLAPGGSATAARAAVAAKPPEPELTEPEPTEPQPMEPERVRPRQGSVRRRGRGWLVALDQRRVGLPELVGMTYLVELLRNPGRRISALALIGGPAAVPDVLHHGDHHDLLDDQARAAYADRLLDLTAELDEAEANADLGRAERLRLEIDALVEQLEAATGLGGRARSFAHSPERARTAVRKAITRALDRVDAADPVVGSALRAVIATGTTCSYEPTADPTTTWTVDTPT